MSNVETSAAGLLTRAVAYPAAVLIILVLGSASDSTMRWLADAWSLTLEATEVAFAASVLGTTRGLGGWHSAGIQGLVGSPLLTLAVVVVLVLRWRTPGVSERVESGRLTS
ncbi:MAG: hypothetical protein AB8G96_17090 [Phycisphaerales bacterium]